MDSELLAGTAKICINPQDGMFPLPQKMNKLFTSVHDDIYVRAIVINNGINTFAYVVFDLFGVPHTGALKKRIADELGIDEKFILLADSYNHGAPREDIQTFDTSHCGMDVGERVEQYFNYCENAGFEAVKRAKLQLQPVRFGVGTGRSYINVFRDQQFSDGWKLGVDFEGPSDKTLTVFRFDRMDGSPLAYWLNYTIYGNMTYIAREKGSDETGVSADLPGAAIRFIEESSCGSAVVLWSSGAAGDQDPIIMGSLPDFQPDGSRQTMVVEKTAVYQYCNYLGKRLALDAINIGKSIKTEDKLSISAEEMFITLPGQRPSGSAVMGEMTEGPDVKLRVQLIKLGANLIYGMSCAPVCPIGLRLKAISPFRNTMLVTHAGEACGYIADDLGCERKTFQYYGMRIRKGYAEPALTEAFWQMLHNMDI